MSTWAYTNETAQPGQIVLKTEIALPAYNGMTDAQISAAFAAQTEPDTSAVDMAAVRRTAIENRIWGKLKAFSTRAFVTTAATQDLTNACMNFMSLFTELAGQANLVRGNALWNAMDADLTLMTGSAGGGPVLTVAQANFMRALGDRTRPRWDTVPFADDITAARAM